VPSGANSDSVTSVLSKAGGCGRIDEEARSCWKSLRPYFPSLVAIYLRLLYCARYNIVLVVNEKKKFGEWHAKNNAMDYSAPSISLRRYAR
jgi:hypothetical protein